MSTTTQTHLMTAEELMHLDDDSHRHELIKGELLTMSPAGITHGAVTINLGALLLDYVKANKLGLVVAGDPGFKLETGPDTVLAPDVAFITQDRVISTTGFYPGPPDLAVEVMSPSETLPQVARKTALWLELGAKSVWNINPKKRTVEVSRADGSKHLLHETDVLADDTVPGFRVKVSEIFA
jgi:Uma2 family endonuclease